MKTGVFEMPMPDYLAAHGVSQSALKKLGRSPAHMKYALDQPTPSTPDQIWGTIFDIAIFQPDLLETCCHVKPANYQSAKTSDWKKWNGNATECKDWIAARQDKPIISQADFSAVLVMRESVLSHPAVALVLKQGQSGLSLFCEDADTGLQLKARPDWMSGNTIADLKTCQDASVSGFAKTVANFGYDVQAAFYLDVAAMLNLGKEHFFFIAVEKEPPYAVAVYELDAESIEIGRSKYRRLLSKYLDCVIADRWPAYSQNVERLSLPKWAASQEFAAMLLEDSPPVPALEVA